MDTREYAGYLIACTELIAPYGARRVIGGRGVDVCIEACHLWLASNGKNVWHRKTLSLHDIIEPDSRVDVQHVLDAEANARCAYLLQFEMPKSGMVSASVLVQRVAAYIPRALAETGDPFTFLPPAGINMMAALGLHNKGEQYHKGVLRYIEGSSSDGK